ncbi:chemotaxis protein CheD [Archaeoglobales archaeon]|nr:MAG: chemotaxis protein CheD [Archaeoglobales archaeon]
MTEILVGIGEYKIGKKPIILKAIGLGSCVGVAFYDPVLKIGGLAHIMLPGRSDNGCARFAEDAINKMLREMEKLGVKKDRIIAKMAGGAQVFKFITIDTLKIGDRNVKSIEEHLKKLGIKVVARDVGGNKGRSMLFDTSDGSVVVKYSNGDVVWI